MEETPMTTQTQFAKDSLGRSTGRRFNMAAIKRQLCYGQPAVFDEAKFEAKRQKRDRKPVVLFPKVSA
jgi:hypothetical protein